MQPLLTLPQSSPSYHHPQSPASVGKCTDLQTTPKLPRRERLASFSRLIASESFLEFLPNKSKCENEGRRKMRDLSSRSPPTIRISQSNNPSDQELFSEQDSFLKSSGKGYLDINQLPFSPSLLNCKSPNYLSPNYRQPTPTKSPLYNTTRHSSFLGRGSFGNVTLCVYKGSKFALKVTHQKASSIGERNFLRMRHPHLVTILHIAQVSDKVFVCMDFAGYCNLQQVLDTKSELDFPRRLSFCIQIISGLRHCHQHQIVHGDVKPANVIVSPYGICKLGDFGHSISLDSISTDGPLLPPEEIIGTVAYAAPEVLRGARPSPASDMYSFGILLWQVKTRELPFAREHPHVIIYKVAHYGCRPVFINDGDGVSSSYSEIARLCWDRNPSKRLTSIHASNELQEVMRLIKQIKK